MSANAEYAVDSIISILGSNIVTELNAIQIESMSSLATPAPQEYKFGERDPTALTVFPAILVKANRSYSKDDQYGYQERVIELDVITWIVNEDEENLHRFILRYGDAIARVLRVEDNWTPNLHSPRVGDALYSDLYTTNLGLAEGCLNKVEIKQIIS